MGLGPPLFNFDFCLNTFGRIHREQSVTLLWFAYRTSAVEQCCQMVKYNTIFTKMVEFYMLVCMGVGRILSREVLVEFSKSFLKGGQKW